jgi:hypothetical protein
MVGVSAGTIKNMWSSIEDRHRRFGFALLLGGPVEVAFLQICDFLWDHDAAFHEMYIGTVQCMSTGGSRIQHTRGFTRAWAWLLVLHGTLRCASDVTRSDTGFGSVSSAQKRSNRVQGADFARLSSPQNAVGSVRC